MKKVEFKIVFGNTKSAVCCWFCPPAPHKMKVSELRFKRPSKEIPGRVAPDQCESLLYHLLVM